MSSCSSSSSPLLAGAQGGGGGGEGLESSRTREPAFPVSPTSPTSSNGTVSVAERARARLLERGFTDDSSVEAFALTPRERKTPRKRRGLTEAEIAVQRQPENPPTQARKPKWLTVGVRGGENYVNLKDTVSKLGLNTVCEEAKCPNIGECWGGEKGTATATIMLLGDTCTRGCKFCAIKTAALPSPPDPNEPNKVAEAVAKWGLDYVVLTSVDRDDLPDGGSGHFAATIKRLKELNPHLTVEALVSDFAGDVQAVRTVVDSGLDVYAHNVETVKTLQAYVRDYRAGYSQSLSVLKAAKEHRPSLVTKSNIMLGVGERDDEVRETMRDLLAVGVEILTMGQYLRPTKSHMKVTEYITPEKFAQWKAEGEALGFRYVAAGPLVRSSYRAGEFFVQTMLKERRV